MVEYIQILSQMGIGIDLIVNAVNIRRVEAPATGSFDWYDDILQATLKHAKENVLNLVASESMTKVLLYDLYKV